MWSEEILQQIIDYDVNLSKRTWDLLTSMNWESSNFKYTSSESTFIKNNFRRFEQLYFALADDKSRETLEGILNYRLTRNKEYLKKIRSKEKIYFDDTLIEDMPKDREIIDGGAFDGDTVEAFIQKYGEGYKVHCYELEMNNCTKIENKMLEWTNLLTVFIHKAALWSADGKRLHFSGSGLSGKLDVDDTNKAGETVITESIDGYDYKNVGFIKMDIEGAEREALKGARKTINRYAPVLAICAYHLQDDLLVLSELIKSMDCNYSLYLRHYMCSSGDTVLYGIPQK